MKPLEPAGNLPESPMNSQVDITPQNSGNEATPETECSDGPNCVESDQSKGKRVIEREQIDASTIVAQRRIDQWLTEYSHYHQNPLNKIIHIICVPLIVLSILGLLWSVPVAPTVSGPGRWLNFATITVLVISIYYFRLSPRLAMGMLVAASAFLSIIANAEGWFDIQVWVMSALLFVFAWAGQVIGHHFEGKRPAFVSDLQFLLIGPLWILADLYQRLRIKY